MYYKVALKRVSSLRCKIDLEIGPFIYLDITLHFLLMIIPEFSLNKILLWSKKLLFLLVRHNQTRTMSPFILYLYLNPLYSILGGSTTRDEPFTKKPSLVNLRLKPLYKWKIFNHFTLVLSVMNTHDSFCTKKTIKKYSWVVRNWTLS